MNFLIGSDFLSPFPSCYCYLQHLFVTVTFNTSSLLLPSTPATTKIIKKKRNYLPKPTVLATSGLHKTAFSFAEPQDDQCAIAQPMTLLHGQGQQVRYGSLYLNSHLMKHSLLCFRIRALLTFLSSQLEIL